MSLKHDLLHHPLKRRTRYELHDVDAVFRGFDDETVKLVHKSACDEPLTVAMIVASVKFKNVLAEAKGKKGDEVVLVERKKDGQIRPITLVVEGGEGKKRRANRIVKRVKEIAEEYAERNKAKVHYHMEEG